MKAVVLAGGKGTRLMPLTKHIPKVMLSLKGRPVMEHVISHLARNGIRDIIISSGHLGDEIEREFGDGSRLGVRLSYSREDRPMGTAGCLDILRDSLRETFLIYGGDNITDLDLKSFLDFHREKRSLLTVALFSHEERIPWGVYSLKEDSSVEKFTEKPTFNHNAGTMIFCAEPGFLNFIPRESKDPVNITDHILPELIRKGEKIFGYRFTGKWVDIGSIEEYERENRGSP